MSNEKAERLAQCLIDNIDDTELEKAYFLSNIAAAIAKARSDKGLTQKELAAEINVSQSMLSKWENGDYNFTITSLIDAASKLDLDVDIKLTPKANAVVDISSYIILHNSYSAKTFTTTKYNTGISEIIYMEG